MMETESGAQLKLLALLALSFNVGPALAAQRVQAPLPHPPEWGRSLLVCWRPPLRVYLTRSPKKSFLERKQKFRFYPTDKPRKARPEPALFDSVLRFCSYCRLWFGHLSVILCLWSPHETGPEGSRGRGNTLAACDVGVARRLFEAIWSRHMWEKRR